MQQRNIVGILPELIVVLISGFLYSRAVLIASAGEGQLGANFWPKCILAVTMFTCLCEILRKIWTGLRGNQGRGAGSGDLTDASANAHQVDASEVGPWVPWQGIGLTSAYVMCMPWLGYFLASFLFVTAFVYVGNFRRPLMAAFAGIVASLSFVFIFMRIVYVSLPLGVEPFASVSTLLIGVMGVK